MLVVLDADSGKAIQSFPILGVLRNVNPGRMLMSKLTSDRKADRTGAPVEERSIGNHIGRCGGKYVQVIIGGVLPA